jgi:hypothetical protein
VLSAPYPTSEWKRFIPPLSRATISAAPLLEFKEARQKARRCERGGISERSCTNLKAAESQCRMKRMSLVWKSAHAARSNLANRREAFVRNREPLWTPKNPLQL